MSEIVTVKKNKNRIKLIIAILAIVALISGIFVGCSCNTSTAPPKDGENEEQKPGDNNNQDDQNPDGENPDGENEDEEPTPEPEEEPDNVLNLTGMSKVLPIAGLGLAGKTSGITLRKTPAHDYSDAHVVSTTLVNDIMASDFFKMSGISTRSPYESGDHVLENINKANAGDPKEWGSYFHLQINNDNGDYLTINDFYCEGGQTVKPKIDKEIADLIVATTANDFSVEGSVKWDFPMLKLGRWKTLTIRFSDGAKHDIEVCQ